MNARTVKLLAATLLSATLVSCGEGSFVPEGKRFERETAAAEIVSADKIPEQADVATVDPSQLSDGEIVKALDQASGGVQRCLFRYTPDGRPVVAADVGADGKAQRAVVKINGDLVVLAAADADVAGGVAAASGPVRLAIAPGGEGGWGVPDGLREAKLRFAVADQLDVGYGGYYACST